MKQKDAKQNPPLRAYWRVWWRLTKLQFEMQIVNARAAAIFFIFGKLFRLATAFLFVYLVAGRAKALAGYNLEQAILILALFNLTSTLTQLFMRGVYVFRQKVVNGTFDFYLLNPLSELFYSLFSYTDPMDLLLVIPYTGIVFWAWQLTAYPITLLNILYAILAIIFMGVIAFAYHVLVISIGIRYLEVDNTIMLYRDLEKMAAFPIAIYGRYFSSFLTYIIPIALMATIPANIIFGLTNPRVLFLYLVLSLVLVSIALKFWHLSLKSYASASS